MEVEEREDQAVILASISNKLEEARMNNDSEKEPESDPDEEIDQKCQRPRNHKQSQTNQSYPIEFYSFLLSTHGCCNKVSAGDPLSQQWLMDAYIKIESNLVKYIQKTKPNCMLLRSVVSRTIYTIEKR
jgi:hypothetical protein